MHLPLSVIVHNLLWKKCSFFNLWKDCLFTLSSFHLHKYRIGRVKRKKVELYKTIDLRWHAFCLRNMDKRFHHPFTCVVAGPTSCGKTEFVAKFILQYKQIFFLFFLWLFHNFIICCGIFSYISLFVVDVGFLTTFLKVSPKTKTGMITNYAMVICRKDKYCHSWF